MVEIARSELILGGQRSGKSRRAEMLASQWLSQDAQHRAVMLATAQAWDAEMQARIERHQADRAQRLPGMQTVEEPVAIAEAIIKLSTRQTLIVVDCMTLWLTNLLMPANASKALDEKEMQLAAGQLIQAIADASAPVVLVSNEIGLGVIPLGKDVRMFVDAQGRLNQLLAAECSRVTLMSAGLPLTLKGNP
ncbi:MAG: bifunctional adenosylcobinamide kinase/adenosylcobinamide-phosphate guanylyltransferase [Alphaproteobacteria bacterium]|mgnify:CR=1 FL=1|jgi:adenosylcobinamide kinase/adenosylcobinamide-phosphate guanylyltransferase|nr:bifunctional adenosylcobinamide kinase/adenosylcobinamide-phosphate guanylyltransferase [Alphaproteobacteria bacterium]